MMRERLKTLIALTNLCVVLSDSLQLISGKWSQPGIRGNGKERMDAGDTAKECLIRGKESEFQCLGDWKSADRLVKM